MKVVKKLVGVSSVCFALSSANAELVGEWKFPVGDNIDVCTASVGRDLVKFTRTGSPDFVESSDDGVLPGDGHVLAGQNNGFKCYHGLAQGSSYTVVMDVLFPVGTDDSNQYYHALFQPRPNNGGDCSYFLLSDTDHSKFKVWYASGDKKTGYVGDKGLWYRFVITYDGSKKSIYINGNSVRTGDLDSNMAVSGEVFYFLLDNEEEDNALDISYAAIYDSVLTADEIKAHHSRPLAHDSDGSVISQLYYTWDLNESSSWSTLRGDKELSSNDIVCINVTKNDAMLTVDEDVNVAWIEFVNGSGAKLVVAEGKTLSVKGIEGIGIVEVKEGAAVYVDSISGVNSILNNGRFVKTGDGTIELPFNNGSTGTIVVREGTLKVKSVSGKGTSNTVRVKSGATFDMNGVIDNNVNVILENDASIINSGGGHIQAFNSQMISLTLEGNATATATKNFGLVAPNYDETTLNLGSYTLTLNGASNFVMDNTKVTGTGKILVSNGKLVCYSGDKNDACVNGATGDDWSLEIGQKGKLLLYNNFKTSGTGVRSDLTVSNFVNNGSIDADYTTGTLTVKGILLPGNTIRDLKLDDATIKVTGTTPQEVSSAFSASGTIKVDTSEITADKFASAENGLIPVLTIPLGSYKEAFKSWQISGKDASMRSLRWRQNGTDKMTLYVIRPGGIKIIVR